MCSLRLSKSWSSSTSLSSTTLWSERIQTTLHLNRVTHSQVKWWLSFFWPSASWSWTEFFTVRTNFNPAKIKRAKTSKLSKMTQICPRRKRRCQIKRSRRLSTIDLTWHFHSHEISRQTIMQFTVKQQCRQRLSSNSCTERKTTLPTKPGSICLITPIQMAKISKHMRKALCLGSLKLQAKEC